MDLETTRPKHADIWGFKTLKLEIPKDHRLVLSKNVWLDNEFKRPVCLLHIVII